MGIVTDVDRYMGLSEAKPTARRRKRRKGMQHPPQVLQGGSLVCYMWGEEERLIELWVCNRIVLA